MHAPAALCRWRTSSRAISKSPLGLLQRPLVVGVPSRVSLAGSPAAAAAAHLTRPASLSPLSPGPPGRAAWLSTSAARQAKNQIYAPVRNYDSFTTYLSLSTAARTPLLTLWTASWCPTCRVVTPLITSLVESGVGEAHGGVAFTTVEFDAPDIMAASPNPAMTYMITTLPTLLSFDAGEAQTATKVVDARSLGDRQFLVDWIENEARRHGGRGGGGGAGGGSLFGGLFGK